jgi:4-hydroxybenzoate polyprenyltransferase
MLKSLKHLLKIYRIRNWYYQLGIVLIGFALVSKLNLEVIKIILLGFMLLAFAYSFNDYCEKKREKKYFAVPLIISVAMFPFFNYLQISFSILALLITTLYSLKPIALREKPFLVSFANAISVPILFLLGYFYVPILNSIAFVFASVFFFFVLIGQILHEATHIKEDKKDKIVTTAIFLGKEKVKYICYLSLLFSFLISLALFLLNIINIVFLFSTLIFVIFMSIQIQKKDINVELRKIYVTCCALLGMAYIISFYL